MKANSTDITVSGREGVITFEFCSRNWNYKDLSVPEQNVLTYIYLWLFSEKAFEKP